MLTYFVWKKDLESYYISIDDVFVNVFISVFSIPLDILLLPLSLITLIIYKKMRYKRNKKIKE